MTLLHSLTSPFEILSVIMLTMESKLNKKQLMIGWILTTTVGLFLGAVLTLIISTQSYVLAFKFYKSLIIPLSVIGAIIGGLAGGVILGYYQSLILRKFIQGFNNKSYTIATALAFVLISLTLILFDPINNLVKGNKILQVSTEATISVMLVTSIGIAQWFVLKHYLKKAYLWIPANTIALLVGIPSVVALLNIFPMPNPMFFIAYGIFAGCLLGAIVGSITGFTLIKLILLEEPKFSQPDA